MMLIQGLGNTAFSGLLDKGMHLTKKLTVLLVILGYQNVLEETEVYVLQLIVLHFWKVVWFSAACSAFV